MIPNHGLPMTPSSIRHLGLVPPTNSDLAASIGNVLAVDNRYEHTWPGTLLLLSKPGALLN